MTGTVGNLSMKSLDFMVTWVEAWAGPIPDYPSRLRQGLEREKPKLETSTDSRLSGYMTNESYNNLGKCDSSSSKSISYPGKAGCKPRERSQGRLRPAQSTVDSTL